jgi:hypothetical protein
MGKDLRLICDVCADKLKIRQFWQESNLVSVEGCCQNCWNGQPGQYRGHDPLREVDMNIVETIKILEKSW